MRRTFEALASFEQVKVVEEEVSVSSERKRAWIVRTVALAAIAAVAAAALLPTMGNAATRTVRVKGGGQGADTLEVEEIGPMGLFQAAGSSGAAAVRVYAGGGGALLVGDCTASTEPAQGPLPNTGSVSGGQVVTGILVTGTGTVRVTSDAVGGGQVPLANIVVNAENPNEFIGLVNGLTTTAPLTFTGLDGSACNWIVFGN